MLNIIYIICIITIISSIFVSSLLRLWLIREILNLLVYYVVFKISKETSSSDIIQYIFIMFRLSILILIRIIDNNLILLIIRVWRKLRMFPLHTPVIRIVNKLHHSIIIFFFIIPKLPYIVLCSIVPTKFFILPILRIFFISRNLNSNESLRVTIVISTTTIALIFSISISFRFIIYFRRILWRVVIYTLNYNNNTKFQKRNHRLLLNIILPIPRGYSWVIKTMLAQYSVLSFNFSFIFVILSSLPIYYILIIFLKYNNISYNSLQANSVTLNYTLAYLLILLLIIIV